MSAIQQQIQEMEKAVKIKEESEKKVETKEVEEDKDEDPLELNRI